VSTKPPSCRHLTAVDLDPFPDADQALAESIATGGADAVVADRELEVVRP